MIFWREQLEQARNHTLRGTHNMVAALEMHPAHRFMIEVRLRAIIANTIVHV